MHTRLLGVLRATLNPLIPTDATPEEAWQMVKPGGAYLRPSFWWALERSLRFAKSQEKQKRVAEWILAWKQRAEANECPWPPPAINVTPAVLPQPHTT